MELTRQITELELTYEYSNSNFELAEIAHRHAMTLTLFTKCLRRTWDFVLGYDYYNDLTAL